MTRFALDYDGTYERDKGLWDVFIAEALAHGHEVVCVTKREPELAVGMNIPVIYTSRRAKLAVVQEHGLVVDVWIDDSPEGILRNDGQ